MSSKLQGVLTTIAKVMGVPAADLSAETHLETLELDSLDEVEILMLLEEELEVEIDQARIAGCRTIGDIAGVLDKIV